MVFPDIVKRWHHLANACGVEIGDVRVVFGESCERERDCVRSIPFALVRVAVVLSQSYLFSIDGIQIGCDDCSSESLLSPATIIGANDVSNSIISE